MTNHLTVKIAFLDVGQGDTIIISIPETGEAAIVDCLNPDTVFTYLDAQSDHNLIISKHGCPCAGTVIIELGSQVHVLQPEIKFHHEAIIKSHFTNTHKCAI